ncbi:MAG: FAD-binding oxidoreductase [Gemmatimonadota bacterium]|nr:FAD-binding oxidoreductase [Gemmatimonadota bacterium]
MAKTDRGRAASPLSRDRSVREAHARDASGLWRVPDAVARPETASEVAAIVREAASNGTPVTAAGSQTSTTGASITDRGVLMSLRAMSRVLDVDERARTARVEPGLLLGDFQRALAPLGLFFAPDPTSDQECTVGGAIACNASGPRTLRYGPTRAHVRALTVVTANGDTMRVARPAVEKNTAGYLLAQDPVDWFVGSEGTLGIVIEAELALLALPAREIGLAIPLPDEARALAFIVAARESAQVRPRCLEYFDAESFAIARGEAQSASWAPAAGAMVYAEEATDGAEPPLDAWLSLAEQFGAGESDIRVFEGDAAIREARRLRHAVPATMHERVAPFLNAGGRRVSTDWAVPYRDAARAVAMARRHAREAGVDPGIVYGHLGNGHPHQNFVARNPEEVRLMEDVVERTLREVVAMGGTVSAEHGIGKLKTRWLPLQLSPQQIGMMRAIKRELDPAGIFAPGNIL